MYQNCSVVPWFVSWRHLPTFCFSHLLSLVECEGPLGRLNRHDIVLTCVSKRQNCFRCQAPQAHRVHCAHMSHILNPSLLLAWGCLQIRGDENKCQLCLNLAVKNVQKATQKTAEQGLLLFGEVSGHFHTEFGFEIKTCSVQFRSAEVPP